MRAISYIRVSSEEQATEGVSIEAQKAKIEAYCTLRGFEDVVVYVDVAVSAGKPLSTRPQGQHVAALASEVDAVVACKLDRLFRDAVDCLSKVREWDAAGTALHLIDMGGQAIDTSTAMGRFFLTVMSGAAEMERNLIRERTRDAMSHKRNNGERVGHVPFGYRVSKDGRHTGKCQSDDCPGCLHLEVDPEESVTAEMICEFHVRDGVSIRSIALHMNGIERTNRGKPWTKSAVGRLIKSRRNGNCPPRVGV